ncbi:hypothetical protein ID866_12031, partial [Astraeus odoratus]
MAHGMLKFLRPSGWVLELEETTFASYGWSNKDMDPVPPRLRTWTYVVATMTYVKFPYLYLVSLKGMELSGYAIISVVMLMVGTIGARLHVAFPVLSRSSFGFWFSYFAVFSRVVLAMFWFGIQTLIGSQAVYQMLKAIWPSIAMLPNRLPANANITSSGFLCYVLYWFIQLPFMLLSPHKIRWLFLVKGIVVPMSWIAMMIWAFVRVPPSTGLFDQHATISGSQFSWSWLSALNSALGSYATLSVNIPDFTRYAKNERVQFVQPFVIPIVFTLTSFVSIAVTN